MRFKNITSIFNFLFSVWQIPVYQFVLGEIIAYQITKNNPNSTSVPTIKTVKGRVVFELQALGVGGGHDVRQQEKSLEIIGKEPELTGRHIARYVRCKELIPEFRGMLDDGSLTMAAAVKKVMDQNCIKLKADGLRKAAGSLSEGEAQKILGVDRPVKPDAEKPVSVKLPAKLYSRFFSDVAAKDVQVILEAALEQYFERKVVLLPG